MGECNARKHKSDLHVILLVLLLVAWHLTHRFSRSLKGVSKDQDLDLNSSYYILYGTGDTPQGYICILHDTTGAIYQYYLRNLLLCLQRLKVVDSPTMRRPLQLAPL